MRTLAEVEEAKALMNEALEWSVVRWLKEKKRVRKAADRANAALDESIEKSKVGWSKELQAAYAELAGTAKSERMNGELLAFAKEFKHVHDVARRARDEAESVFDEAERELSTRLAREGCRKAVLSWELHEKVIRKAELAITSREPTS